MKTELSNNTNKSQTSEYNSEKEENMIRSGRTSNFGSYKESKISCESKSFVKMSDYSNERNFRKFSNEFNRQQKSAVYLDQKENPLKKNLKKFPEEKSSIVKLDLNICEKSKGQYSNRSDPELLASERIRKIVETVRRERSIILKKESEKKAEQSQEKETRRKLFIKNNRDQKLKDNISLSRNSLVLEEDKENRNLNIIKGSKKIPGKSQNEHLVQKIKIFHQQETPKHHNYNTLETYSYMTESRIQTPITPSNQESQTLFGYHLDAPDLKFDLENSSKNCEKDKSYSYNSMKDPMKFYISGEFLTPLKEPSNQSRSNSFLRYTSFARANEEEDVEMEEDFGRNGTNLNEINYRTDETMEFNFKKKYIFNEAQETKRDKREKIFFEKKFSQDENFLRKKIPSGDFSFKDGQRTTCSSLYKISFLSFLKQLMKAKNIFVNFELEIAVQHYSEKTEFKESLMKFFYSKEIMNSVIYKSSINWRNCEEFWLKNYASNLKIDRLSRFKSPVKRIQSYSWMTQIDQSRGKTIFTMMNNRTRKLLVSTNNLPLNAKKINATFTRNKDIKRKNRYCKNPFDVRPCVFFLNGQAKHLHYYDLVKRKHANVYTPDFSLEGNLKSQFEAFSGFIENYKVYGNHCVVSSGRNMVLVRLGNFEEVRKVECQSRILSVFFMDDLKVMVVPEVGKKVEFFDFERFKKDVLVISKKIPRSEFFNFLLVFR